MIKTKAIEMFAKADIKVNGTRAWDIQVHDERFYERLLFHGSVALGECYVDGWWTCKDVEQFIYRVLHYRLVDRMHLVSVVATSNNSKSPKSVFKHR